MELITGYKSLISTIKTLAASAAKVNETIHLVAVSCLAHVRDHNDYSPCEALLNALPNGQRVKTLAFWFKHFSAGKLTFNQDKETKSWQGKLAKQRNVADFDVIKSMETTFGDLREEKNPETVFTTDMLVKMLAKRAEKNELDDTGERVSTRAAIVMAATLKRAAEKLRTEPLFDALLKEEDAINAAIKAKKNAAKGVAEKPTRAAQPAELIALVDELSTPLQYAPYTVAAKREQSAA